MCGVAEVFAREELRIMRRIIMLVAVALVMGAMVLALAMPAFAVPTQPRENKGNFGQCHKMLNNGGITGGTNSEFNDQYNPPSANQEGPRGLCRDKIRA
jgi:hypothetical protein